MPGVKGAGGPPPKRSDQRRRSNKTAAEARAGGATKADGTPAQQLPADPAWHSVALVWYRSLAESGQSKLYQASDWGLAYVLAESISRELGDQPIIVGKGPTAHVELVKMPMKGATLSAFLKGCTALMVAEGDRRRVALELQLPSAPKPDDGKPATVVDMAAWMKEQGAG